MPDDPRDLRKQAARFRRLASIRTVGGHEADYHLFTVALSLEQRAEETERTLTAKGDEPAR
jgi:hypothetical protein